MLSWRLSPFLDIRKIFRKDQITHNFYSCEKAFTRFLFHFSTTHPPPFIPTLLSNNMLGKHSSVSALSDTAVFLLRHKQRSSDVNLIISSMENISKDDSRANTMCWGSQHSSFKVPQSPLLFLPTQSKICCAEDIDTSPPPPFLSSHWWATTARQRGYLVPNVELWVPIPNPNAPMEHYKATSRDGKREQASSSASTRANLLKESFACT